MSKALIVSDIHIYNYQSNNLSFDGDIPSRLTGYLHLADNLMTFCTDYKIDSVLVPGDLSHQAVIRPMVWNVIAKFMTKLANCGTVWCVHGQHDLDEKSAKPSSFNSIVTVAKQVANVQYAHDQVKHPWGKGGPSVYFLGWTPHIPRLEDMPEADIFVGHNLVATAENALGHTFTSGYDAQALSKKYKFSIIGDIHKGQMLFGNVLIPGPPIQHSFSDPTTCGVWVLDTDTLAVTFEQIDDPIFPKFILVDSEDDIVPKDNTFYKMKSRTKSIQKFVKNVGASATDLKQLTEDTIRALKIDKQDRIIELATEMLDEVSASGSHVALPPMAIDRIQIENFGSVKSLDLPLVDPSAKVLILGKVGSGKSSILKAVCFGLFGRTIEAKTNDHFVPVTFDGSTGTCVKIGLVNTDTKTRYEITRTLNDPKEGSALRITQIDNGGSSEIKKASIRDTQTFVNELIGLDFEDFVTLCYYYQKKTSFFGTMSPKYQSQLLMKFMGDLEERLNRLSDHVREKVGALVKRSNELGGSLQTLEQQVLNHEARVGELQRIDSADDEILSKIDQAVPDQDRQVVLAIVKDSDSSSLDKCVKLLQAYSMEGVTTLEQFHKQIEEARSGLIMLDQMSQERDNRMRSINAEQNSLTQAIKTRVDQIASLEKNECPTCKRKFDTEPDPKKIKKLRDENESATEQLQNLSSMASEVQGELGQIESKRTALQDAAQKFNVVAKQLADFQTLLGEVTKDNSAEIKALKVVMAQTKEDADKVEAQIATVEEELDEHKFIQSRVFSNRGVFARALEGVGVVLSEYMNQLLRDADSDVQVRIDTVTYNKSGTPSSKLGITTDFGSGKVLEYDQLSGGQAMLIDVLSIVGFYNVLAGKHQLTHGLLGFLALDEVIQYVDDAYVDVIKSILDSVQSWSTLLVSHNPQLSKVFGRTVLAELKDGISEYELIGF